MTHKYKITIIGGTGAVGVYFARQLQMSDFVVTLLGRPGSNQLNNSHELFANMEMKFLKKNILTSTIAI